MVNGARPGKRHRLAGTAGRLHGGDERLDRYRRLRATPSSSMPTSHSARRRVTTPQLLASIITHEWGHAIGLGHSPLADTLMAGPPDAAYSNLSDLTPDDVQGCRCLYGPPAGVQAGFVCSLPTQDRFRSSAGRDAWPAARDRCARTTARAAMTDQQRSRSAEQRFRDRDQPVQCRHHACARRDVHVRAFAPSLRTPRCARARRSSTPRKARTGFPLRVEGLAPRRRRHLLPCRRRRSTSRDVVERPAGIGVRLGTDARPPGRRHLRDVVHLRCERQGDVAVDDRRCVPAPTTYAGTLYRTTGPALDVDPVRPASRCSASRWATRSSTFADAGNGTFAYTSTASRRSKPITRLAVRPAADMHVRRLDQSGARHQFPGQLVDRRAAANPVGACISRTRAKIIFASWFAYDRDGTPLWLSATASSDGQRRLQRDVIRTTGPAFNSVPFDPQRVARTPVGSLDADLRRRQQRAIRVHGHDRQSAGQRSRNPSSSHASSSGAPAPSASSGKREPVK